MTEKKEPRKNEVLAVVVVVVTSSNTMALMARKSKLSSLSYVLIAFKRK